MASALALLACGCALAPLSQTHGQERSRAGAEAAVPLRGTAVDGPFSLDVDPRFLAPENPFQPARPTARTGEPMLLPGTEAQAGPSRNGGATSRRPASRASRPVQAPVTGRAARAVRPEQPATMRMGTAPPTVTGGLRVRPVTSTRIVAQPADGLATAAVRPARPAQADPWEPLGLRLGTFIVTPSITQSLGYDTNPSRSSTAPKGSAVSRTDGELRVRSDWSTHSFTSSLRAGYSYYTSQRDASRPDAVGISNLRLNVTRDTDIDIDTRLSLETQRPGSTNFNAATTDRPNVYGYGGSAGVTQRFNRLSVNLRGSVDRTTYDDARDTLGGLIRQSDRNVTQLGGRLRLGYEVTPGVQPFVEVGADQRVFDERTDQNGFRRGSTGATARVGSSFELTRQLTGEASVGYQQRDFEDPRLKELRGVVGDAALVWSMTPLTTVTLRAATELADTNLPNVSGAVNRRLGIEVSHELRRNWSVTGLASAARSRFDGTGLTEDSWSLGLRTEYRFTRTTAVRASFTHERLRSTAPGSDYTANIILVGLRMQL
ncbi:MAG: outer membrane beta-barrel protein [Bosea sp.]|nr:outer membrane beta-barrel protein [Bosea sp. (in: a-proteobacteria)]